MDTVVVGTTQKEDDSDRFDVLDRVLEDAGFWNTLDERFLGSGKTKKDFLVAVKPNLMMFYSKEDMSVITEPVLVEHLITKIADKGYTNIVLAESQNVFGNWFKNRDVENVAFHAGYSPTNYRIVDLTMDVVAHVYPGTLGTYLVGKTWKDADFRISFAKNKTHFSCYYTLTIKNIYETTPEQNKFREYHADREVNSVTIEMIKEFPVHFGIIDGIWSADGLLGIKADFSPNHSKTIIAGSNIIAVAIVGGEKMGINAVKNSFVKLAIDTFGMADIKVIGDTSRYKDWKNVGPLVDRFLDYGEELYSFSNLMCFISSVMDEEAFPRKIIASNTTLALRSIVLSILRILNKGGVI